jgi:hypothetical protein
MPRRQRWLAVVRLRLLPGERELVRLRPSPGAFLPRYLGGTALLAWAAVVAFGSLPTGFLALVVIAAAVPVLGGLALYLPRRRMARLLLCFLSGGAVVVAAAMTALADPKVACAAALAASGLFALVLTETDRRMRRYHLTNLRIVHLGGLWERRGWTLHYDAVLDLDVRQDPLGRILGHGTVVPVLAAEKPQPVAKPTRRRKVAVPAIQDGTPAGLPARLWGVRPIGRVRRLVEAFVTDATATDYLRSEQQTQKKVGQAMQELGRANLLR